MFMLKFFRRHHYWGQQTGDILSSKSKNELELKKTHLIETYPGFTFCIEEIEKDE